MIEYGLGKYGDGTGLYRPNSTKKQRENAIVTKTVKALEKLFPEAFVMKMHGGSYQRSGLPDLYISIYGKSIWIEMKRPGADTTALQKAKLRKLATTGAFCGTAESPERAIEIVNKVVNRWYAAWDAQRKAFVALNGLGTNNEILILLEPESEEVK